MIANKPTLRRIALLLLLAPSCLLVGAAEARHPQRVRPVEEVPFNRKISNIAPLAFGMDAIEASQALGVPLVFVKGRPGNETLLAVRDDGGSGFFPRNDRIYLQFRRGRLTGIKGDWGRNWMWR